jgi:hypothetical protein
MTEVPADEAWPQRESGPVVRPYAVTGGRTEPADGDVLTLLTVLVATGRPLPTDLAADTALPLGVVRVLVADLTELGAITVVAQRSADQQTGNVLQEILNGLRAL